MSKKKSVPGEGKLNYSFTGKLWKNKGVGGWHFVTLPGHLSRKIRKVHFSSEEGWGRLKVVAQVGSTEWKTAIWYDTKAVAFLLPIKAGIRKKESLVDQSNVKVKLTLEPAEWL